MRNSLYAKSAKHIGKPETSASRRTVTLIHCLFEKDVLTAERLWGKRIWDSYFCRCCDFHLAFGQVAKVNSQYNNVWRFKDTQNNARCRSAGVVEREVEADHESSVLDLEPLD